MSTSIFVLKNGEYLGPFTREGLENEVHAGRISKDEIAGIKGTTELKRVFDYISPSRPTTEPINADPPRQQTKLIYVKHGADQYELSLGQIVEQLRRGKLDPQDKHYCGNSVGWIPLSASKEISESAHIPFVPVTPDARTWRNLTDHPLMGSPTGPRHAYKVIFWTCLIFYVLTAINLLMLLTGDVEAIGTIIMMLPLTLWLHIRKSTIAATLLMLLAVYALIMFVIIIFSEFSDRFFLQVFFFLPLSIVQVRLCIASIQACNLLRRATSPSQDVDEIPSET